MLRPSKLAARPLWMHQRRSVSSWRHNNNDILQGVPRRGSTHRKSANPRGATISHPLPYHDRYHSSLFVSRTSSSCGKSSSGSCLPSRMHPSPLLPNQQPKEAFHEHFPTSCSITPSRSEEQEEDEAPKYRQLFFNLMDVSTVLATAAATATEPTSLFNYFMETVISTTVPCTIVCTSVGVTVWLLRRTSQTKRAKKRKKSKDDEDDAAWNSKTNPAKELYDDLYEDRSTQTPKSPWQELAQFLRDSSSTATSNKKKKQQIRKFNRGIPAQQYMTLKHWNQRLDSYQYSLVAATQSKAKAAAEYRSKNFDRALGRAFQTASVNGTTVDGNVPWANHTKSQLLRLEEDFLHKGARLVQEIQTLQTKLTHTVIEDQMEQLGVEAFEMDPSPAEQSDDVATDDNDNKNKDNTGNDAPDKKSEEASATGVSEKEGSTPQSTATKTTAIITTILSDKEKEASKQKWLKELSENQNELNELEFTFIQKVVATMGKEHATGIRVALLGDIAVRGTGGLLRQLQERPLTAIMDALFHSKQVNGNHNNDDDAGGDTSSPIVTAQPGTLFVARFSGDLRASQVSKLREEVTAIVRSARPGIDEAVVVLESGGGTVTGYGLAAGQVQRLKNHGIKLTIAVEQVAASGGYMMCCVADRIVGSPFAIFGSIGVITEIPNFFNRMQREGVEFATVTAGKYKRTITPFKEVTSEDTEKTKEQLESVLAMFKRFVQENRPQLAVDMDEKVATGEVWFGTDAVELGLCDEIKTVDELLTEYIDSGWDVYELEYKPPAKFKNRFASVLPVDDDGAAMGDADPDSESSIARGIRWIIRLIASEVKTMISQEALHQNENHGSRFRMGEGYVARYDGAERVRAEGRDPRS